MNDRIQVNGCVMLHLDMWWQPQTVDLCCENVLSTQNWKTYSKSIS